jgi:hypothetical protein
MAKMTLGKYIEKLDKLADIVGYDVEVLNVQHTRFPPYTKIYSEPINPKIIQPKTNPKVVIN